jgi:hypothetical protein
MVGLGLAEVAMFQAPVNARRVRAQKVCGDALRA